MSEIKQNNDSLKNEILENRRFGVALPLLCLLTNESFETGDFLTLEKIIPFLKSTGIKILQILPLNDIGFGRSPYSSISAFAIDPIYISLKKLGIQRFTRKEKIASTEINIRRVRELKVRYLREYFLKSNSAELKNEISKFIENQKWIHSYIAFKVLYEKYNGKPFLEWNEEYSPELEKKVLEENKEEVEFISFLQYTAFTQLSNIKKLFDENKIYLKGDMPILTAKNSADVWSKRKFFHLELSAGAPPDQFSETGQNWSFPIFNWDEMKKENYSWWKDRLQYLEHFFHIYRIDHVLGMYRIWAIPETAKSAKEGYFFPQRGITKLEFTELGLDPIEFVNRKIIYEFEKDKFIFYWDFYKYEGYYTLNEEVKQKLYPLSHKYLTDEETHWRKNGEEVLNFFFTSTNMLACAEDLGAVPTFVRDSIIENKIIGLDIIRWTRSLENGKFITPEGYRKLAVSSFSVHDTSIGLDWWQDLPAQDKEDFAKLIELEKGENVLKKFLEFSLSTNSQFSIQLIHDILFEESLFDHLEKDLNPILNPKKHRINTPGTDEEKNWGYRLPIRVEDLNSNLELKKNLLGIIAKTNRNHE